MVRVSSIGGGFGARDHRSFKVMEDGAEAGIGLRVLRPPDAKLGETTHEVVADFGEALALFRSRFVRGRQRGVSRNGAASRIKPEVRHRLQVL
jgi:hypothetical protein